MAERATETRRASVGGYALCRRLGVGGMGEVWLARQRGLGGIERAVALKLIHPGFGHELARLQFAEEARMSMLMQHPNVVRAFDAGNVGACRYLAMEWVDGPSLAEVAAHFRFRGRRLPYRVTAYVVRALLRALAHLQAVPQPGGRPLRVVHNDVSPHNVLLSRCGEVKLADFGIAAIAGVRPAERIVGGKPRYMAPERVRSRSRLDPRADVFSVGAILHELLCSRRFVPHSGARWNHRIPALEASDVPDELRRLHGALLQPSYRHRPTAAEALDLLGDAVPDDDAARELGRICEDVAAGESRLEEPTTSSSDATAADRTCTTRTASRPTPTRRPWWLRAGPSPVTLGLLSTIALVSLTAIAVALVG